MKLIDNKRRFSSSQLIILGFILLILIGTALLMLPISSSSGNVTSFHDAIFTATSAVCVTGLIVKDTATYWSTFGQAVIISLIQIGGMGVVTLAVLVAIISKRKIGLMQRSTMQEAISAPNVGGIVKLTGFLIKITLIVEILGAILMIPVFYPEFGARGIWYAFFHSISAFCNAGFDLMGVKEQFSSLTSYSANVYLSCIIMFLIVFGGIGYLTWNDIKTNKFRIKRYRMQSKVILMVSAILIFLPAIYFFLFEFNDSKWSYMTVSEKISNSFFQSVTTRTAGFNTVNLLDISEGGQAIMIILMLIGGSPGSTAGGMKTTTVAVLFATVMAVFRRRDSAHLYDRRIVDGIVKHAVTILLMYLTLFLLSAIIISKVESLPMSVTMFETASAVGTVGLTLGVTPQLSLVSRAILIALMFIGRVGGLTLMFAALSGIKHNVSQMPQEKITVG